MNASNSGNSTKPSLRHERIAAALKQRPVASSLALLAIVALLSVCYSQSSQSPTGITTSQEKDLVETAMQLTPNEVMNLASRPLQEIVRISGSTAPRSQAEVASEVAGRIETVTVRPGDQVTKGDVLVQIDMETLRIQLKQQRSTAEATRAQLTLAETQLERTAKLVEKALTPASSLEEMQANVNQLRASLAALQAQVESAELSLENATVTAPISGFVAARSVDPGEFVTVGKALVTLVDLSTLEVRAFAPVSAGALIRPGQTAQLSVEGVRDRTFPGRVERISPVAAEGTRSIPVYISLDNREGLLRGGMFATGNIVVQEAVALALPASALREDVQGTYVLTVNEQHLVRQPMVPSRLWNDGRVVEIASGLSPGQVVVSAALPQLRPGDRITMVEGLVVNSAVDTERQAQPKADL